MPWPPRRVNPRTKGKGKYRKSCRLSGSPWNKTRGTSPRGGSARQATVKELPVSKGLAGVSMRLNPGGIRELHWHAIAAEWAFVVKGRVRTTVIGPDGTSEINDFDPGDVWYFPRGHGHMLQGLGPGETHFVLIFDDGAFSEFGTFSSTDWLGHTPPEVLSKALGLPVSAFATFPKEELYIVQGRIPPAEIPALTRAASGLLTRRTVIPCWRSCLIPASPAARSDA